MTTQANYSMVWSLSCSRSNITNIQSCLSLLLYQYMRYPGWVVQCQTITAWSHCMALLINIGAAREALAREGRVCVRLYQAQPSCALIQLSERLLLLHHRALFSCLITRVHQWSVAQCCSYFQSRSLMEILKASGMNACCTEQVETKMDNLFSKLLSQ